MWRIYCAGAAYPIVRARSGRHPALYLREQPAGFWYQVAVLIYLRVALNPTPILELDGYWIDHPPAGGGHAGDVVVTATRRSPVAI